MLVESMAVTSSLDRFLVNKNTIQKMAMRSDWDCFYILWPMLQRESKTDRYFLNIRYDIFTFSILVPSHTGASRHLLH